MPLHGWTATSDITPADGERVWVVTRHGTVRQAVYREAVQPYWVDFAGTVKLDTYTYWTAIDAQSDSTVPRSTSRSYRSRMTVRNG